MLALWSDLYIVFFFFKQKTAYEMRISDWSSDVCSSDLARRSRRPAVGARPPPSRYRAGRICARRDRRQSARSAGAISAAGPAVGVGRGGDLVGAVRPGRHLVDRRQHPGAAVPGRARSEEHTSELQSLMRISYAVFCLKKKNKKTI